MARLTALPPPAGLAAALARKRALARATLLFEAVWPAVWPALGVLGGFVVVALLDLPAHLAPWPRALLPGVVLLLAGALLWQGLRRIVRPDPAAVDRRLEHDSGLRHRPLAALQDRPAIQSTEGAALWALHQTRLRAQLGRLRLHRPRPGLAARDRWAFRFMLMLGLVAALVMAGAEAPNRLLAAVWPGMPPGPAAPGTVVQAWATPPSYTGLPPVFLQHGGTPPPIPAGSHLTVSVTGGVGDPVLSLDEETTPFQALDAASWQAQRDLGPLDGPGRLSIRRGGAVVADWMLTVLPDHVPIIGFTEPPGPMGPMGPAGRPAARTRLAWKAEDDYGVTQVQAELRLMDRPDAPPLILNASLSGSPKAAHGAVVQDLTAHPWAGLTVKARMVARDAPGQRGESDDMMFVLPERAFTNPVARAVVAIRKQLSRTPDERRSAHVALDAVADRPELYDNSLKVALALHGAGALLIRGRGQQAVDEAQARLWTLALSLEEGAVDRAAQALAQARQEAKDAMEAARQDPANAAKKAELDQKLQALREAIQKQFEALAEQARRDGTEMPFDPNTPQMTARDMDKMAQRAEDAARDGRMEDAKQQMAELEKLLEQLQNARPEHGEQREQRRAQRRQQGQDQMDAVQDMVQREGGLLDRSRSRSDTQDQPPAAQPPAQQPGQTGPQDQRMQDTRRQQAMRRALGELMQRFGDLTGQIPAPLGQADTAMRDAGEATAAGRDAAAAAAQQKAIEALQQGGRSMSQQLSRQFGQGQGEGEGEGEDGQEMGEGDQGQNGPGDNATENRDGSASGQRPGEQRRRSVRRDPLGRPLPQDVEGTTGNDGEGLGNLPIPSEQEQARTRELQDELRRRGADRTRPQPELDYIDRLLKSF